MGCEKRPHYGMPGDRPGWCATHRKEGMVNVTGIKCEVEGCGKRASYAFEPHRRTRCAEHKQPGQTDVAHR